MVAAVLRTFTRREYTFTRAPTLKLPEVTGVGVTTGVGTGVGAGGATGTGFGATLTVTFSCQQNFTAPDAGSVNALLPQVTPPVNVPIVVCEPKLTP